MYNASNNSQFSFSDQFFGRKIPVQDDHPYVVLEKMIDWDDVNDHFRQYYRNTGRYSVPIKHMVLLLLIKHLEHLSDEEIVYKLSTDLAMQMIMNIPFLECQISYYTVKTKRGLVKKMKGYIDPSNLSLFRKRIGVEGIKFIEALMERKIKKKKRSYRLVFDTTVVQANIEYPTDINLLEKSRQYLIRLIDKYLENKPRTYRRKARKIFLNYIKLGKQNRKKTRKVHGQMIRFVRRNLKQVISGISTQKMTKKEREVVETIKVLLNQQMELHKKIPRNGSKLGIQIKNRIVSIFKPHVRPMPRGKIPNPTEFGSKILLQYSNSQLKVLSITSENEADKTMVEEFIKNWKGYTIGGDRGFHSKENTTRAKDSKVRKCFIEPKGKLHLMKTKALKKIRSLRSALEGKIGLAKRKYGMNKILYNRKDLGDEQWIRLGILAMNFKQNL